MCVQSGRGVFSSLVNRRLLVKRKGACAGVLEIFCRISAHSRVKRTKWRNHRDRRVRHHPFRLLEVETNVASTERVAFESDNAASGRADVGLRAN